LQIVAATSGIQRSFAALRMKAFKSTGEEHIGTEVVGISRRRLRGETILLVLLLVLGVALRVAGFDPALPPSPDEWNLANEARMVVALGGAGVPAIAEDIRMHPGLWYEPSPLRVGYLFPLAGMMQLIHDENRLPGLVLSMICSVGSLLLVALLGWRFLSREAALVALLFAAVSPLELTLARRAWQDSFTELLALALLMLCAEVVTRAVASTRRQTILLVAIALLGAFSLTVKETSVAVFGFCLAWVLVVLVRRHDWRGIAVLLGASVVFSLAAAGLLGHLMGGVGAAVDFERTWLRLSPLGVYSLEFETGPARTYLLALFWVSPVVLLTALIGAAVLAVGRSRGLRAPVVAKILVVFTVVFFTLPVLAQHRLNLRYASVAYCTLTLVAGVGVSWLLGLLRGVLAPLGRVAMSCVLLFALGVAAYRDAAYFRSHFSWPKMWDLSVRMVLDVEAGNEPQR